MALLVECAGGKASTGMFNGSVHDVDLEPTASYGARHPGRCATPHHLEAQLGRVGRRPP